MLGFSRERLYQRVLEWIVVRVFVRTHSRDYRLPSFLTFGVNVMTAVRGKDGFLCLRVRYPSELEKTIRDVPCFCISPSADVVPSR
jgi:hypothetical protein